MSNAELAFWNHYGTLGDLLTDTGAAPNGAYWLYDWYGADDRQHGHRRSARHPGGRPGRRGVRQSRPQQGRRHLRRRQRLDRGDRQRAGSAPPRRAASTSSSSTPRRPGGPPPWPGRSRSPTPRTRSATARSRCPVAMNPSYGYHLVITPVSTGLDQLAGRQLHDHEPGQRPEPRHRNGGTAAGTLVDQAAADGAEPDVETRPGGRGPVPDRQPGQRAASRGQRRVRCQRSERADLGQRIHPGPALAAHPRRRRP